jgi:hypothetical protein
MKFRHIAAVALLLAVGTASADVSGTVKNILVFNNAGNVILFDLNNTAGPYAACNTYHRYAVSLNSPAGQALYAQVLAAKLSGKTIIVGNTGTCNPNLDPYSEEVNAVVMP